MKANSCYIWNKLKLLVNELTKDFLHMKITKDCYIWRKWEEEVEVARRGRWKWEGEGEEENEKEK